MEVNTEKDMRGGKVKPGYKLCGTHIIFDITMDGKFTWKSRFVADGHSTHESSSITYSSVVLREIMWLELLIVSLNDLYISSCDIGNTYVNAKCPETLCTLAGSEFGSEKRTVIIIARALYGLKSSRAVWREILAEKIRAMEYIGTQVNLDVWIKQNTKPNGQYYYCYMLVYVYDVLHIHHNSKIDMEKLNGYYRLKDGVSSPSRYLSANIGEVQLKDGCDIWSILCVDYIKGTI